MIEIPESDVQGRIDTGWICCIVKCYEVARVDDGNTKMCKRHADMWKHGYGRTFMQIEHEQNTEPVHIMNGVRNQLRADQRSRAGIK